MRPNGLDEARSKFTSEVSGSIVDSDQNVRKEKKTDTTEIQSDDQGGTQHCQQSQTSKPARVAKTNPPLYVSISTSTMFNLGGNALRSRTFARTPVVHAAKNTELYSSEVPAN